MNAVAVVSIYVVTNRASYLKCDVSVSVYVAVVWIQDQATGPGLLDGLCQTMLLVTMMTTKPDTAIKQPNTWSQGAQAKSSDVSAAMAKFLDYEAPKQNQPK